MDLKIWCLALSRDVCWGKFFVTSKVNTVLLITARWFNTDLYIWVVYLMQLQLYSRRWKVFAHCKLATYLSIFQFHHLFTTIFFSNLLITALESRYILYYCHASCYWLLTLPPHGILLVQIPFFIYYHGQLPLSVATSSDCHYHLYFESSTSTIKHPEHRIVFFYVMLFFDSVLFLF